ncbi:MAG: hypothetical protein MJ212_03100, partial [Alphaproteobacteria bacterium]|nr:hypothetical protein [Alphaproteobacteria bacterium]
LKEAFVAPKPEPKKENKETVSAPLKEAFVAPKPEPKKENKEVIENNNPHALHSYDDAMQLIKNALNDKEPVSLDDIETSAVSLESQDSSFNTSADDDLWKSFTSTNQENADASSSEAEWEYADENGNPIEDDNTEWEYVDENGNPIEDDNAEWEYVDENGNPIEADNTKWEYVDENGNQTAKTNK